MKLREIENYYITKASYGDKTISNVDMLEFCFNEHKELELEEIERE